MPNFRRAWIPGGTYFFTINLLQRNHNNLLVRHIDSLRNFIVWWNRGFIHQTGLEAVATIWVIATTHAVQYAFGYYTLRLEISM